MRIAEGAQRRLRAKGKSRVLPRNCAAAELASHGPVPPASYYPTASATGLSEVRSHFLYSKHKYCEVYRVRSF